MVMWGAICGGVLGLLWRGHDGEIHLVVGMVLGALAGLGFAGPCGRRSRRPWRRSRRLRLWSLRRASTSRLDFQATLPQPPTPPPTPPTAQPRPSPAQPTEAAAPRSRRPPHSAGHGPGFSAAIPSCAWACWCCSSDWPSWRSSPSTMRCCRPNFGLPPSARRASRCSRAASGCAARQPDKLAYALTLQGAGVAVLYLTVFAAFRLYQFLPAGAAFAALGLVCAFAAVIAVAQNAMPMAFIGFAGGFAAPILVSTGQGNHVGVVLLLPAARRGHRRAGLGQGLATAQPAGFLRHLRRGHLWGVLKYRPEHFDTTEPFLIAFFLVYLVASLLYALRHSLDPSRRWTRP